MACTCAAIRLTTAITPIGISRRPAPLPHPLTDASTQLSFLPRPIPFTCDPASPIPRCRRDAAKPMPPPPGPPAQAVQQSFFVTIIWPGTPLVVPLTPRPPSTRVSVHITYVCGFHRAAPALLLSEQRRRRPPPPARYRLAPALPALYPATPMCRWERIQSGPECKRWLYR